MPDLGGAIRQIIENYSSKKRAEVLLESMEAGEISPDEARSSMAEFAYKMRPDYAATVDAQIRRAAIERDLPVFKAQLARSLGVDPATLEKLSIESFEPLLAIEAAGGRGGGGTGRSRLVPIPIGGGKYRKGWVPPDSPEPTAFVGEEYEMPPTLEERMAASDEAAREREARLEEMRIAAEERGTERQIAGETRRAQLGLEYEDKKRTEAKVRAAKKLYVGAARTLEGVDRAMTSQTPLGALGKALQGAESLLAQAQAFGYLQPISSRDRRNAVNSLLDVLPKGSPFAAEVKANKELQADLMNLAFLYAAVQFEQSGRALNNDEYRRIYETLGFGSGDPAQIAAATRRAMATSMELFEVETGISPRSFLDPGVYNSIRGSDVVAPGDIGIVDPAKAAQLQQENPGQYDLTPDERARLERALGTGAQPNLRMGP